LRKGIRVSFSFFASSLAAKWAGSVGKRAAQSAPGEYARKLRTPSSSDTIVAMRTRWRRTARLL
jgi:hypothetical protein